MTAVPARPVPAIAAMAAVLAAFVARPLLPGLQGAFGLSGVLLVVGAAWPLEHEPGRVPADGAAVALVCGCLCFALSRLAAGQHASGSLGSLSGAQLGAVVVAAVAEEAFFRRFAYAVLAPGGMAPALLGSSCLFALAHVTVYGWWVLPIDLGAGAVLGWQRWASGTWVVPAATHVAANLMVLL